MTELSLERLLFPQHRAESLPVADAGRAGPGWFESSWELRRGLEVHESGEADVRLRTWIEDFLGARPDASPDGRALREPHGIESRCARTAAPSSITASA